jgi:hypothetical protein
MTSPSGHTSHGVHWERFSIIEQLANVGSEVDRTIRAHQTGNTTRFTNALERALSLFDLTAADPRWAGHRRCEVLRAREEFCRLFFEPDPPPSSADGLRRYFLAFGVAANARSGR